MAELSIPNHSNVTILELPLEGTTTPLSSLDVVVVITRRDIDVGHLLRRFCFFVHVCERHFEETKGKGREGEGNGCRMESCGFLYIRGKWALPRSGEDTRDKVSRGEKTANLCPWRLLPSLSLCSITQALPYRVGPTSHPSR